MGFMRDHRVRYHVDDRTILLFDGMVVIAVKRSAYRLTYRRLDLTTEKYLYALRLVISDLNLFLSGMNVPTIQKKRGATLKKGKVDGTHAESNQRLPHRI